MKATTVELRAHRLWPLPLWIMSIRVGRGSPQWSLVTPWGAW